MLELKDYLLAKTFEEAIEVAQELGIRASKALIFGMHDRNPVVRDAPDNTTALVNEINDLFAVVSMLADQGIIPEDWLCEERILAKKDKVMAYAERCVQIGTLCPSSLR